MSRHSFPTLPDPVIEWTRADGLKVHGHFIDVDRLAGLKPEASVLVCRGLNDYGWLPEEPYPIHRYPQRVIIQPAARRLVIELSWHGDWPLAYYAQPACMILSGSPTTVRRRAMANGRQLEVDRVALAESLLFDFIPRRRTLWQGIHKTLAGETVTLSLREGIIEQTAPRVPHFNSREGRINPIESSAASERTGRHGMLAHVAALLDKMWRFTWKPPRLDSPRGFRWLMPFDGAIEGQTMWASMQKDDEAARLIFPGQPTCPQFGCAESAAARNRQAVSPVLPAREKMTEAARHMAFLTGGLATPYHGSTFLAVSHLADSRALGDGLVHPFLGAAHNGLYVPPASEDGALDDLDNYDVPVHDFVKRTLQGNRFFVRLGESLREAVLKDLAAVQNDNLRINEPRHFEEAFLIADRQSALCAWECAAVEFFLPVVKPFANERYTTLFAGLSSFDRAQQVLFREAARKLWPHLGELAGDSPDPVAWPAWALHPRRLSIQTLQHCVAASSGGRITVLDKQTRLPSAPWLRQDLFLPIANGAEIITELLEIPFTAQDALSCGLRSAPDEALAHRLAAVGWILS